MAIISDTRNVKLGVCSVIYGGIDLGYTKGGVEVSVTTDTHKVELDQFGKSPINELVMGRECKVKVPLAETTLENMVRTMPGATLVQTGGVAANGTVTLPGTNAAADQTIIINGKTVTAKSSAPNAYNLEYLIGVDVDASGANLAAMLNASTDSKIAQATYTYTPASNLLTATYKYKGTEGNAFTLAVGTYTGVTVSGGTLASGANPTAAKVVVTSGVGLDLLATAKELRLHPYGKLDSDRSEDFTVHLAGTGGGLAFAYKLEDERIFNVEFSGYPDANNGNRLFTIGDMAAV
jgi:hypothetical protein